MSATGHRVGRRTFLQIAGASGLASVVCFYGGCNKTGRRGKTAAKGKKVIVMSGSTASTRVLCHAADGRQGRLPNLNRVCGKAERLLARSARASRRRVRSRGQTSSPAPVAGVHGIFDFIHRDPARQCSSGILGVPDGRSPAPSGWDVGDHRIPLDVLALQPRSRRSSMLKSLGHALLGPSGRGRGFPRGSTTFRPTTRRANRQQGNQHCLAGMGTPDLLGSATERTRSSRRGRRVRSQKAVPGGMTKPLRFKNDKGTPSQR